MFKISGLKLVVDKNCLKDTEKRTTLGYFIRFIPFLKRFGNEFKRVPAMFITPTMIICHPMYRQQIKEIFKDR